MISRITFILSFVGLLVVSLSATAQAREVTPYDYVASFNNSTSSFGPFQNVGTLAVDQTTGHVYVIDRTQDAVHKFDSAGNPVAFSEPSLSGATAIGVPGIEPQRSFIAVDNSGGPTQGRIYVLDIGSPPGLGQVPRIHGFEPSGEPLGGNWPLCGLGCDELENWRSRPLAVAVDGDGVVWVSVAPFGRAEGIQNANPPLLTPFSPDGEVLSDRQIQVTGMPAALDLDGAGNLYVSTARASSDNPVRKYVPDSAFVQGSDLPDGYLSFTMGGALRDGDLAVARASELVLANHSSRVGVYTLSGEQVDSFGAPDAPYPGLLNSRGVGINETTGRVYVSNARSPQHTIDVFEPGALVTVPDLVTGGVTELSGREARLHGTVDPDDGGDTTVCRFDWGTTTALGNTAPCEEGNALPSGGGPQQVSAKIAGLARGTEYYYRVVSGNAQGPLQYGSSREFRASDAPMLQDPHVATATALTAAIEAGIDPEGGQTTYRVEFGESPSYDRSLPIPPKSRSLDCYVQPAGIKPRRCPGRLLWATSDTQVPEGVQSIEVELSGLKQDTVYHYRLIAENQAGSTASVDRTFRTTPIFQLDACPNDLVRQQTGSGELLDCRAYELVSPTDAGGYDVASDLGADQTPLPGFPEADDRALYTMYGGGLPGVGNPTNRGDDPYLATRSEEERAWVTDYIGLPGDTPSSSPFSSTLAGADNALSVFAFGGPLICDPCFEDGSTNLPLRLPDGTLTKGMSGSLDPGPANPAGEVRRHVSSDGTHLVFGTTAQYRPDGNSNGDVTIYSRNLLTGTTQTVSKLPNGETMTGAGISSLGVSSDGSRVIVAQKVGTDQAGNDYHRLYMHSDGDAGSVELAPGASSGVLFSGMTDDGSSVFFASPEQLTPDDTDASADLYRSGIVDGGVALTRLSAGAGSAGNSDGCAPRPNSVNDHWNSVDGSAHCGVAAIAGGAGIAGDDGSAYFLSPEQLEGGSGTLDAPNLYLAPAEGPPRFVATLESDLTAPEHVKTVHPFSHFFASLTGDRFHLAIHAGSGSVYLLEESTDTLKKFDLQGNPSNFSALGSNTLGGFELSASYNQVAVDNSGGATDGNIYVTHLGGANNNRVRIYDSTGTFLGELNGAGTPQGSFELLVTGVAVGPSGTLYVSTMATNEKSGRIHRYEPSGSVPTESDHDSTLSDANRMPGQIAVDSNSTVYTKFASASFGIPIFTGSLELWKYPPSAFEGGPATATLIEKEARTVHVDPTNDHLYVASTGKVIEYLPSGEVHGEFGFGTLFEPSGLAANSDIGMVYVGDRAQNQKHVAVFGTELAADRMVDSPIVVDAVNDAAERQPSLFQVNDSGETAAFESTVPLTGHEQRGLAQVFRHAADTGQLTCVSCSTPGTRSRSPGSLATNGNSITDDGRVFFNSADPLVSRDSNEQQDVYEWSGGHGVSGASELVSTGLSETGSSLLSVSTDGTDAFFFTREKLVPQDLNGGTMKLYTARENGGFFVLPPTQPCLASDECRGAGTLPARPATIQSLAGASGQFREHGQACSISSLVHDSDRAARKAKALRRKASRLSGNRAIQLRERARQATRASRVARNAARLCRATQRKEHETRGGE